jgi:hypothetical protein
MNHLTDEQLEGWLAGDSSSEETRAHLQSCARCHSEAVALRDGISRYNLALRQQAARAQSSNLAGNFAPKKALAMHRLRWAGAGALALLLTVQTAWMLKPHAAPIARPPIASAPANAQAASVMSDDELLEAVNNDLSRDVPRALAPVSAITVARNKIAAASAIAARKASIK